MESREQPIRYPISGLPLLAATLMLSATAQAASSVVLPCEQVERDLQSLEVPVNALAADSVDHAPIDPEMMDEESSGTESVTPVLKLGPRVTTILREVFDMTAEESAHQTSKQFSSSPLADTDEPSEASESDDAANDKSELPRFQRRMLRTDI